MGKGTTVKATSADVMKAGMSLFEFRKKNCDDPQIEHRHPMLYRGYKWKDLPTVEKIYYCDMATTVMVSFGVTVPNAPSLEELAA